MKSRSSWVSTVLCLAITTIIGSHAGSARPLGPTGPEPAWVTQLQKEGWQREREGVLQRQGKEGQIETLTYGEGGRLWRERNLVEQITFLQGRYNTQPSEELARVIDRLRGDLDQTRGATISNEDPMAFSEQLNACDFAFGASAAADPMSGSQAPGVQSQASAYFHNNCGYIGDTYAYAYVEGTMGTTFSTKMMEDPKYNGTWIDSTAGWTLTASSSCYSRAYARVSSSSMGLFYQIEDLNYSCPYPPVISITGPTFVYTDNYTPCSNVTWTASVSGGTPPYGTVNWYIGTTYQGSGNTLTQNYCYSNQYITVRAVVSDSTSLSAEASFGTQFQYYYNDPCGGDPCCGQYCCYQAVVSSSEPNQLRPPYDCPYQQVPY